MLCPQASTKNDIRMLLSVTVAEITRNKLYILHFYLESSYAICVTIANRGAIETRCHFKDAAPLKQQSLSKSGKFSTTERSK